MRLLIAIVGISIAASSAAEQKSSEQQIAETLRALPEALRDGAAVIGYDSNGESTVLRAGSNEMICWADDPNLSDARGRFYVNCFPKSLEAFENRRSELSVDTEEALWKILDAEVKSGKLNVPKFAVRYTLRAHSAEAALHLTVIHMPYATAETLDGISTEPSNTRPWLMSADTVGAHIMLPGL